MQLLATPEVAEACVVGIPHPKWDERPMLFIVTNSGEPIEKESIIEFLSDKVASGGYQMKLFS